MYTLDQSKYSEVAAAAALAVRPTTRIPSEVAGKNRSVDLLLIALPLWCVVTEARALAVDDKGGVMQPVGYAVRGGPWLHTHCGQPGQSP